MALSDLGITIKLDSDALKSMTGAAEIAAGAIARVGDSIKGMSYDYSDRIKHIVESDPWITTIGPTKISGDSMTHRAHTAEMVITDHGIAKFLTESLSAEAKVDLIGDGKNPRIRNDNLKSFPVGTQITAQFRIGAAGKRILISARKSEGISVASMAAKAAVPSIYSAVPTKAEPITKDEVTPRFGTFVEDELFIDEPPTERKRPVTNGFYVAPETALSFTTAATLLDRHPDVAVKVLMVGASGYGKTTTPTMFAKKRGMNVYRMNCASIRDPEEWFGYREAVNGTTIFVESEFIKRLVAGNVVMIFDEYNRLEPFLHNTLYPLLDDDQATTIYGTRFKIGPNTLIVATINTGAQFTGTFQLDAANLRRFNLFCEVGPMPLEAEIDVLVSRTGIDELYARDIVNTAASLRQIDGVECSTATTLEIAKIVKAGIKLRDAFEVVVVARTDNPEDISNNPRKLALDVINIKIGHFIFDPILYNYFDGISFS